MRKVLLLTTAFVMALSLSLQAQERTVSGAVTSDEDGSGLPGVSVLLKGTSIGVVTDIDGNYKISVPSEGGTLVYSYIGMVSQEVEIGSRTTIDVAMSSDVQQLSEVVVTAFGITREKASLGYAVSQVSSDLVENRPEADIGRILRGKAPGVNINQTSGLAGTGTNIIIRGFSTITGNNQPLFIVDGVPFDGSTNTDRGFTTGGATASSRFLDLDPNNISDVSILKGLSATVLYGEAGKNGVILITTKTGSGGRSAKGTEVTFSQGLSFTEVANIPKYQNTYGNGFSGNFGWFFSNWGPSFDTRGSNGIAADGTIDHPYDQGQYNDDFPEFIGVRYPYQPYESVENFFRTGKVYNTSVGMKKNVGDNSVISFNYSLMNDRGFIPEDKNTYERHNFSLGGQTKLDNGFSVNYSFNMVNSDRVAPPAAAGYGSNPSSVSLFANLVYTPRSIDLLNLPYQSPIDGSQVYYRRGSAIANPLWVLNNNSDYENVNRYWAAINAQYEINDWLSVQWRGSVDTYNFKSWREVNKGGAQIVDGQMSTSNRRNKIDDHFATLNFTKDVGSDVSISGRIGGNIRRVFFERVTVNSTEQFVFDLFNHSNFRVHDGTSFLQENITNGVLGDVTASYGDWLYATVSARNDWTSTLEKENNSQFYPSASVSAIITDAVPSLSNNDVLNFLKIRAGYGTSAGFPSPYSTRNTLNTDIERTQTINGTSVPINSVSNRLGNPNLVPERISELEFGVEARIFDKLGIDFTYYDRQSDDLIVDLNLDPATGYTVTRSNGAAVENTGVELGVNITPVQTNDFSWTINANYTRNRNVVVSIPEGIDQFAFSGFTNLGNFAEPGKPYGIMKGSTFSKDPDGNLIVGSTGSYIEDNTLRDIGDPNPNWLGNVSNTLSWKGLTFSMLWTYQDGGDIYSVTTRTMYARGNTIDTDVDRFIPVVLPGVKLDENGNYVPNDIQTYLGDAGFDGYFGADEGSIFDGTRIRLQEASLSYTVPNSILSKTPFGSANVTFFGQNLFYKAPNFPEGINYDPDVLSLGVGNGQGFEYITGPTVRKYGVTLNATF